MNEKLRKLLLYLSILGISFITLLFVTMSTQIGLSVKNKCFIAQEKYQGECVEALMKTLDDDKNSIKERNDAIWALGQIGDSRALSTVQKYYTGEIPQREPYSEMLSQYEMKKALNLLNGGFNATHLVRKLENL